MTTSSTKEIRQALQMAFDDSSLSAFCFDYYVEVYEMFSQGMRKDDKITRLLDYCRRRPSGFQELLDNMRKEYQISESEREELSPLIDALEAYIHNNKNLIQSPAQFEPPMQLPPRAAHFTNRQAEVARLRSKLQPGQVVTLCGPGGIGKSALAAEILWRLAIDNKPPMAFPDGIIFHSFYNHPQAELALAEIARAFGENPYEGTPATAAKRALAGKRALLVLDGAEDADDLPAVLAVRAGCGVLITTRQRKDAGAIRQDVPPLNEDEAISLLQAWSGTHAADDTIAAQIVQFLGGLPLAVRLVGRYLDQQEESAVDYLNWLKTTPLVALNQGQRRLDSVPVLLEKCLTQVSSPARWALSVAGMQALAPFERQVVAKALDISVNQARSLLGQLVNYGLLIRVEKQYQVTHALIHTYVRQRMSATTEMGDRVAAYYETKVRQHSKLGAEGYRQLDGVRPHIMAILTKLTELKRWQAISKLARTVDDYLNYRAYWLERITTVKAGLAAARELKNQRDEGTFLNDLGNTYRDLGEVDVAIELHQEALTISRKMGDQLNESNYLKDLGKDFNYLRQTDKAIEHFEKGLVIAHAIGAHDYEVYYLNHLGMAYRNIRQMDRALDYYQQALVLARKIGSTYHEGNILGNLGVVRYQLGQAQEAIGYLEQALTIASEIGDRRIQGSRLGDLGTAYYELGQTTKAIEYYQQALAIARDIGYRRGEVWHLGNLGYVYYELGEVTKAIESYQHVIYISDKIGDPESKSRRLGSLGVIYDHLGQVTQAIEYLQQALTVADKIADRQLQAIHLGCLADIYLHLGNVSRAMSYYEKALSIARQIDFRREEGWLLGELGNVYRAQGKVARAVEHYRQALDIAREIGQRKREGEWLSSLGEAYRLQGQVAEAIKHHQQALTIARSIRHRKDEVTSLGYLGAVYCDLGLVDQAINSHQEALKIARSIRYRRGEGIQLGHLGKAYHALGQVEQAITFYEQALDISREIGYRRGEALAAWHLGLLYEESDPAGAMALMSVRVTYEHEINHVDADVHAQRVAQIEAGLKDNKKVESC